MASSNEVIITSNKKPIWPWVIVFLLIAGAGFYFYNLYLKNPCKVPVKYAIGDVDSRFKISSAEVKEISVDAVNRWNSETNDTLLVYDPTATLKINLVYDDRQAKVDRLNSEVAILDSSGNAIDTARSKLELMISTYEKDLSKYNAQVSYWNAQGGAPQDVYSQLQNDKINLESRRNQINSYSSLINSQIDEHNSNIGQVNGEIEADKNKIITQGLYYSGENKIDIFTFGNKEELRLVLVHELGHALSLGHDEAETSIMYPMLGGQNLADPTLSTEDIQMFDSTCHSTLGPLKKMLQNLFHPSTSISE